MSPACNLSPVWVMIALIAMQSPDLIPPWAQLLAVIAFIVWLWTLSQRPPKG